MRARGSKDLKERESDNKKERGRDQVIEREATRGTAVLRDHVEKEERSMSRGKDETEQQKGGDKRAGRKNIWSRREKGRRCEEAVRGKAALEGCLA